MLQAVACRALCRDSPASKLQVSCTGDVTHYKAVIGFSGPSAFLVEILGVGEALSYTPLCLCGGAL